MNIDYRRAILRIFLIMSAMFVVVAITISSCSKDDDGDEAIGKGSGGNGSGSKGGDGDEASGKGSGGNGSGSKGGDGDEASGKGSGGNGSGSKGGDGGEAIGNGSGSKGGDEAVVLTCEEGHGYKIVFADKKFENAFVIAGKDGDLNRTIDVKFDQLTRVNGFGAAMPEFKSLYKTMKEANVDVGLKVKEKDGVIGFWGDYSAGLSRFILGLNIKDQTGTIDGSGPAVAAVDGTRGKVAKPDEDAPGFTNDSYTMALTSGPAWVTGAGWVPYNVTKVDGGVFHDQILGGPGEIDTWFYDTIGRLEDFPPVIHIEGLRSRRVPLLLLFSTDVGLELEDFVKGHTSTDNYESNKGWQHLFSIKPCDAEVKNGLIAAQVTKKGATAEIAGTLIDAEKLHIKSIIAAGSHLENEVLAKMTSGADTAKKNIFVGSFIGNPVTEVADLGFATINYNADAGTNITENKFHTVTKLELVCRTFITGISEDQPDLFEAPGEGAVVTADLFTDGAKELKCYLSITNLYPEWYEAVVQEYNTANTLDKQFKVEAAAEDRLVAGQYDTQTKTVGLVIADTGDVALNTDESRTLFYTVPDAFNEIQQAKWKVFVGQNGVKTTYGTLKFNFVRPDIK